MEKIKCICVMRDLVRAFSQLESDLMQRYQVTLNEAMVLCCIGQEKVSASYISTHIGLLPSHASKVIRSVEKKQFICRHLGEEDKRQMYFELTQQGKDCLARLRAEGVDVPELLQPFFSCEDSTECVEEHS